MTITETKKTDWEHIATGLYSAFTNDGFEPHECVLPEICRRCFAVKRFRDAKVRKHRKRAGVK